MHGWKQHLDDWKGCQPGEGDGEVARESPGSLLLELPSQVEPGNLLSDSDTRT